MYDLIFCGFGSLGRSCLEELIQSGYTIRYVLTHKDLSSESVDSLALSKNIPFQYTDLRKDPLLLDELIKFHSKFLISVNYRYIIPEALIRNSNYPLNIHGSLLPKYRGRAPHIWAIINGETFTGVTCHVMEETVDTGPIYSQVKIPISETATGNDLIEEYKKIYPIVLRESLLKIKSNEPALPQDHSQATYFGKRIPDMGYIDILRTRKAIINFVRAQTKPYPGAYMFLPTGEKLIIFKMEEYNSENIETNIPIGKIQKINAGYLLMVSDGPVIITEYEIK